MKNLIKFMSFTLILSLSIICLDYFVFTGEIKNSRYHQFFLEEENSLDVVVIGSSTVRQGISPAIAWDEFKVTSFNISNSPIHPEVIKLAIDEIGRTQSPKVVFVDLTGLTYQKEKDEKSFVKDFISAIPNSEYKDTLVAKYEEYFDDEIELFKNHNDFRNPNYFNIFSNQNEYLKGFSPVYDVSVLKGTKTNKEENKTSNLPSDGQKYFEGIMEVCAKYPHINFLFGVMPKYVNEGHAEEIYKLRSIVPTLKKYGHKWVEFDDYTDEVGLLPSEDFADTGHLNYKGATKFTKFFINYIDELYGDVLGNEHSDSVIVNFNKAAKNYKKHISKKSFFLI